MLKIDLKKISKRNWFRIVWFSIVTIFFIWQWSSYQAKGVKKELLESDNKIEVIEDNSKISFIHDTSSILEIIFFPGGLVDPKSYIPLSRKIAESGYNIHIIKMPWRMSTKGYNNIKKIFNLKNKQKKFILGGHSQGGKMAAQFTYENPELISGLYLLGTSHPRDIDMSKIQIPSIKIYAENDGLASVDEVIQNKLKLPKETQLSLIKGGNHSQFGYFGKLLFDGKATKSREKQHQETVNILLNHFEKIKTN